MSPRGAEFSPEIDHREMQPRPGFPRKDRLQIALRLIHALLVRQTPSRRQSMNMRVYGERRRIEGLYEYDTGRLVSHARQGLERVHISWNDAPVLVHEDLGEPFDISCLPRCQSAGPDFLQDLVDRELGHFRGRRPL